MSIIEQKNISQLTIFPEVSAVNVQWVNRVIRNGATIAEAYERKSYTQEQKEEFLTEVDGAEAYLRALGWE